MFKFFARAPDESRCSLCGRSSNQVNRLIAGKFGTACGDCLVDSLLLIDGGLERALCQELEQRVRSLTPHQRASLAQAIGSLTTSRLPFFKIIDLLTSQRDGPACYQLLVRSDRALWRWSDWINFTWSCAAVGDFEAVVDLEPDLPPALLEDPDSRHIIRMNVIWARCHTSPTATADELLSYVREMSEAASYWRQQVGEREAAAALRCACAEVTAAKCFLLLDQVERALERFEAADATAAGIQPWAALLWGDVLAARGDSSGAQEKWSIASNSEEATLDGLLQREIELRLNSDECP